MSVYIIRHGQTEWNARGILQGQKNSNLTPLGKKQALSAAKFLKDREDIILARIYLSPLKRVIDFWSLIKNELPERIIRSVNIEPRIQELRFGDWEGRTKDEIEKKYPEQYDKRKKNIWAYKPKNGESLIELKARIDAFLGDIDLNETNIIVTHEMASKVLRLKLLNLDSESINKLEHKNNVIYIVNEKTSTEVLIGT